MLETTSLGVSIPLHVCIMHALMPIYIITIIETGIACFEHNTRCMVLLYKANTVPIAWSWAIKFSAAFCL